jgi:hypothetical protein
MEARLGCAAAGAAARLAAIATLALSAAASASAGEPEHHSSLRIQLSEKRAPAVRRAVTGAARRLARPECQRLLSEFSDTEGRLLLSRVEALGATPDSYPALVVFADGLNSRGCRAGVLAVTSPGSRVVRVCDAFLHTEPTLAEWVVIHELLHTLGLDESRYSNGQIHRRVVDRCGR